MLAGTKEIYRISAEGLECYYANKLKDDTGKTGYILGISFLIKHVEQIFFYLFINNGILQNVSSKHGNNQRKRASNSCVIMKTSLQIKKDKQLI